MSLEPLKPRNAADVNAVADLHLALLSESLVVKFGDRFLRRFYYVKLVEDGLIGCTICRADGRVIGFISYTAHALDFMSRGFRKHFLSLCWIMALSLLARPALIKDLLFLLRMIRERRAEVHGPNSNGLGEALSMAVLPEYESHVPQGGSSRLAIRLFHSAAHALREAGADRVQLMVQPSNRAANLFYMAMGCPFEKIQKSGMTIHRYIYHLNG